MNLYRIELNVTSTEWSTCECYVEAESEKEAREKFEVDPDKYEWDNWQIQDSECRGWDVECVEQEVPLTKNKVMVDMYGRKDKEVTSEASDTHQSTCDKKEQ